MSYTPVSQTAFSKSIVQNIASDPTSTSLTDLTVFPFRYVRLDTLISYFNSYCLEVSDTEAGCTNGTQGAALGAIPIAQVQNGTGINSLWSFAIMGQGYNVAGGTWLSTGDVVVSGISSSIAFANYTGSFDTNLWAALEADPSVKATWCLFADSSICPTNYQPAVKYSQTILNGFSFYMKSGDPTAGGSTLLGLCFGMYNAVIGEVNNANLVNFSASNPFFTPETTALTGPRSMAQGGNSGNSTEWALTVTSPFNHVQATSQNVSLYYNTNFATFGYWDIMPTYAYTYCCNQNDFIGTPSVTNFAPYCGLYTSTDSSNYSTQCQTLFNTLCGGNSSQIISTAPGVPVNGMFLSQCQTYCRNGVAPSCDTWATSYCGSLGDTNALLLANQGLCSCFMSNSFQTTYRNSLLENIPADDASLVSEDPYCIFPNCSRSSYLNASNQTIEVLHPQANINGQSCPPLVICNQDIMFNNSGTITGSVSVAQNIEACGLNTSTSTGTGTSTGTTTSTATGTGTATGTSSSSTLIILYIVGGIVAVVAIFALVAFLSKKKKPVTSTKPSRPAATRSN